MQIDLLPSIPEDHKAGFVSIVGKPNAGKSTLLNALLDTKLSIISPKAQTTRHRILGFDNGDNYQIIFSDTPGIILPKYILHERMMGYVQHAVRDADVLIVLAALNETFPEDLLLTLAEKVNIPKILVLNKTDIVTAAKIQERRTYFTEQVTFSDVVEISALKGENVGQLRELILRHLPLSPPYYDKEELSDRPERFFISEMIREKIFLFLSDEIPYSCEVEVLTFESTHSKAGEPLVRISANIHVERNTQKQILIGEGARTVKKIGTAARKDIEEFLQSKVFLEIFVKVSPDWKTKDNYLRSFGYAK